MRIPNWYRSESHGVTFHTAWNLQASGMVTHGFSTRIGGESEPPYDTLNLGLAVEDDPRKVLANRRAFASALGMDAERIVVPKQVHSNAVVRVDASHAGSGALDPESGIAGPDALITNTPGLPLALHFADCVCVFLLDPDHRAIGMAHAGWRGTAGRVAAKTVEAMTREFGADPGKLIAAIGPSICRSCYEVGEDVAREMFRAFPHDERVVRQSSSTKWRADLRIANLIALREAGLRLDSIAVSEQCTSCNAREFFSYRRDSQTGRMGGWMSLALV